MSFAQNSQNYGLPDPQLKFQSEPTQPQPRLNTLYTQDLQQSCQKYFSYGEPDFNLQETRKIEPIKFEEQETVKRSQPMDKLCSQIPLPPLRFSQVQKSIQVLRRAIPDIVNDALVDRMYLTLFKNFNIPQQKEKVEIKMGSSSKSKAQKPYKEGRNNKNQNKSYEQIISQEKMRLFKKHEELRALKIEGKQAKRKQKQEAKKAKVTSKKKVLKQIWNDQIESYFIELYKSKKQFQQIKSHLSYKYPQYKEYFTYSQLRSEAYKIFRLAIRKLYYVITNFKESSKLPDLLKITQIRYNFIFYYKQGANVRYLLIDLYRQEELNRNLLSKVIIGINNLCIELEQDKEVMSRIGHRAGRRRASSQSNRYELQDDEPQPKSRYQLGDNEPQENNKDYFLDDFNGQEDYFDVQ